MTGLDLMREEMLLRGCTKQQCESRVVAVVLDILTKNGHMYEMKKAVEDDETEKVKKLRGEKYNLESRISEMKAELKSLEGKKENLDKTLEDAKEYIEAFNKTIGECETESGRDMLRTAQMFVNSVSVNTAYDNTAFIIGLAAILTNGKVEPMKELKKMNPRIFDIKGETEWRYPRY